MGRLQKGFWAAVAALTVFAIWNVLNPKAEAGITVGPVAVVQSINLVPAGATYDAGTNTTGWAGWVEQNLGAAYYLNVVSNHTYFYVKNANDIGVWFGNTPNPTANFLSTSGFFTAQTNIIALIDNLSGGDPVTAQIYTVITNEYQYYYSVVITNATLSGIQWNTNGGVIQLWSVDGTGDGVGNIIQFGNPASPSVTNLFSMLCNYNHLGFGNGSVVAFLGNQFTFNGQQGNSTTGTIVNAGTQAQPNPSAFNVHFWGNTVTALNPFDVSGLYTWHSDYWNGSAATESFIFSGTTRGDANGDTVLTFFDAQQPAQAYANNIDYTKPHRWDLISNLGVKNYGAWIVDATNVTPGAVYFMNFAMADQSLAVTQATTLSITNWPNILTNTAATTANALRTRTVIYSATSQTLTWSIPAPLNPVWISDAGGASAPASVNGTLVVDAEIQVANSKTNLLLNAKH